MVQLVDSLDLSTNVELLDRFEEISDSWVLLVTSKDFLCLLVPNIGRKRQRTAHILITTPTESQQTHLSGRYTSSTVKMAKLRSSRKSRRVMRALGLMPRVSIVSCDASRVMGMVKRFPSARRLFSQTLYSRKKITNQHSYSLCNKSRKRIAIPIVVLFIHETYSKVMTQLASPVLPSDRDGCAGKTYPRED